MKIITTFRHKTQNEELKRYVHKLSKSIEKYTKILHRVYVVFALDNKNKDFSQISCHISLHLLGKKNIEVKAVCTKAKDAFDQTFNLLRCELANSNKYRIKSVF